MHISHRSTEELDAFVATMVGRAQWAGYGLVLIYVPAINMNDMKRLCNPNGAVFISYESPHYVVRGVFFCLPASSRVFIHQACDRLWE